MNIALWIVQILFALLFLMAGGKKAFQAEQTKKSMDWAKDVSNSKLIAIGVAEILGAIGLILPWALDIVPILTPLAAIGLALIMIFAALLHGKRKENKAIVSNLIILILAVVVVIGRLI